MLLLTYSLLDTITCFISEGNFKKIILIYSSFMNEKIILYSSVMLKWMHNAVHTL